MAAKYAETATLARRAGLQILQRDEPMRSADAMSDAMDRCDAMPMRCRCDADAMRCRCDEPM
jgi:hypothetical protein